MLARRGRGGDEDAGVADLVVDPADDPPATHLDLALVGMGFGDPVARLLRRRDVVAVAREDDAGRADGLEVGLAATLEPRVVAGEATAPRRSGASPRRRENGRRPTISRTRGSARAAGASISFHMSSYFPRKVRMADPSGWMGSSAGQAPGVDPFTGRPRQWCRVRPAGGHGARSWLPRRWAP